MNTTPHPAAGGDVRDELDILTAGLANGVLSAQYDWHSALYELRARAADTIARLRAELAEARAALTELSAAIAGISKHTGAEMTDESVAAWQRLNDAQVAARAILAHTQGADHD